MARYRVIYAIDVHADSTLEAALQAYAGILAPEMEPVFDVYRESEYVAQIDLADLPALRNGHDPDLMLAEESR